MNYFNQFSERLNFRKLTKADIPQWIQFFKNNDRLKYLGMDLTVADEVHAEDWIRAQFLRYEKSGLGQLAMEVKGTAELVGLGGIIERQLLCKKEYEIAYSVIPKYWGNGYATELAKTMMRYGELNIDTNRFISIIEKSNAESANVAMKNGMKIMFDTQYLGMDVNVFGKEF
ncbi:MAG: GNAT family N-acetyltransferase [Crocinitomicaceae bacterium]